MKFDQFTLEEKTNYIYTLFIWTASNCSPNRDGGTGEIRVDPQSRVFTTQECFNQNVKNGIFYSHQSGLLHDSDGVQLMGCKNEFFGPRTLKGALQNLLTRIAFITGKKEKEVTAADMFDHCFDIPFFGLVNSNGLNHDAFPASITGSAGLIYLPKTVTQVKIDNRGISNAFSQPKSSGSEEPKGMPGSHFTDYLEEGVFICLGLFNVKQLRFIASQKLGLKDREAVSTRMEQLYRLYLTGIWEGYKLLGYASTMRKGQQPFALYVNQAEQLPDKYISDPASLLADEKGVLPMHVSFSQTMSRLEERLTPWKNRFGREWEEMAKMDL
ncbi:MAG: hypothetical protein JRH00_07600 [Deltaproteobacteria bacterium]|nr:hypothetical protein [Deltaproteobacteria bacterium]